MPEGSSSPDRQTSAKPVENYVKILEIERKFGRFKMTQKARHIPLLTRLTGTRIDTGVAKLGGLASLGAGIALTISALSPGGHKADAQTYPLTNEVAGVTVESVNKAPPPPQQLIDNRNTTQSPSTSSQKRAEVAPPPPAAPVEQKQAPEQKPPPAKPIPEFPDHKLTSEEITQRVIDIIPKDMKEDAKDAIPRLVKAFKEHGIDSPEVLAYMLATVEHESKFQPMEEYDAEAHAVKYKYKGGVAYAGKGYGMMTGVDIYKLVGDYIGEDLVGNPYLLMRDKDVSAQSVAGYFIVKGTAKLAAAHEFLEARTTYNAGEFDSDDPVFFRTPYNIRDRAEEYLRLIKIGQMTQALNEQLPPIIAQQAKR